jgi:hypothetical protein
MNVTKAPRLEGLVREAAAASSPCVSLYMPTARAGRETLGGSLQLKNLLREARHQAEQGGIDKRTIDGVLAPAERRVDDAQFWQHQEAGLALLLAPGFEHVVPAPIAFEPWALVADALHVRPLLPLTGDVEFLLLAFSQNHVRLLRGTRFRLEELHHMNLPKSLAAALWADDHERTLQVHSHRTPNATAGVFHATGGVGGTAEVHKEELERYFRAIDDALLASPEGHADMPLLLACVDYCAAIYRGVSRHPHLVAEPIAGNPDHTSDEQLHASAWPLLAPRLQQANAAAFARYCELAGTGRTSDRLDEIVNAAQIGRVAELFTQRAGHRWGRPSQDSLAPPEVHDERQPGDVDLIDRAVVATMTQRGAVHVVDDGILELRDGLAATFRY